MTLAETFLENLKSGNTDEAISAFKQALAEGHQQYKEDEKNRILESYGFVKEEQEEKPEPESEENGNTTKE